jgi:hypothetical protein
MNADTLDDADDSELLLVFQLQWDDFLLLALILVATFQLCRFGLRRCCRRRNNQSAWRNDMSIVLNRPLNRTSVHVDVVRLFDRVRLEGAAFRDVSSLLAATLRQFDEDQCDDVIRLIDVYLAPVAPSADLSAIELARLFREHAARFAALRSSAVLRASVNQGVLAPPFIVLRQRFATDSDPVLSLVRFRNEPRSWTIDISTRDDQVDIKHRRVFECEYFSDADAKTAQLSFTFVLQLDIRLHGATTLDQFDIQCRTADLTFATACDDKLQRRIATLIELH